MGCKKVGRTSSSVHMLERTRTSVLRRRGLSLLEVILALAILAISMAAIGELLRMGNRSAREAQLTTRAQILCESILSEIVCGSLPPDPVTRAPIITDPDWFYTTELAATEEQGVMLLAVTVETQIELSRPPGFMLVRWIPDPGIELPDEPEDPSDTNDDSSTNDPTNINAPPGGNSGGNNNGGGNGGGNNNTGGGGNAPGNVPSNVPGGLPGNLPSDVPEDLLNRLR